MSIDPMALFFGIVIGSLGLALFVYGKKQARAPQLAVGLVLMVIPYFTTGSTQLVGVTSLLLLGLWWMLRLGW